MHIEVTHFDVCSFYLGACAGVCAYSIPVMIDLIRGYIDLRKKTT